MQALLLPPTMRARIDPGDALRDDDLAQIYLCDSQPRAGRAWLRSNFVATVDGAATGSDSRSGSINTEADHVVFDLLRAVSDAVLLGAGTLEKEQYSGLEPPTAFAEQRDSLGLSDELPLVCVSNRGRVPDCLAGEPHVWLATCHDAPQVGASRELVDGRVILAGTDAVHLPTLIADLVSRGWVRLLTEGGPHLHGSLLAEGLIDEVCLSTSPMIVAGPGPRIAVSHLMDVPVTPLSLVEHEGTLMGRWLVTR